MAPKGGKETDVSAIAANPSLLARAKEAAQYVISGVMPGTWMSPLQPIRPVAPETVQPRAFDFPVGYNTRFQPRTGRGNSYETLIALSETCDILRLAIETRKDQMEKLEWQIRPRAGSTTTDDDPRIKQLTDFFMYPDKEHDWSGWLRALLEDHFVLDAVSIYKRLDRKDRLYSLDLLDGSTIFPVIDETGRRPMAPSPAYQQVIKGVPAIDFTSDELIFAPRNVRNRTPLGYSPVEQVLVTVNIAIRRATSQLTYYTDGNVSDGVFWLPDTWNPDQFKSFQELWDSLHVGDLAERRRAKFLPGQKDSFQQIVQPPLKDQYDEWLARVICYAFSLPPSAFVQQVNRATAETAQQAALEEGLAPIQKWVKGIIDRVIFHDFGATDIEFAWLNEKEIDPKVAAEIQSIKLQRGVITLNEARSQDGLDPYEGVGDTPGLQTAAGFVALPTEEDIAAAKDASLAARQAIAEGAPDDEEPAKAHGLKKKYSDPLKRPAAIKAHSAIRDTVNAVFDRAAHHVASQLRGMAVVGKADDEDEKRKQRAKSIADDINLFDLKEVKALAGALDDLATDVTNAALTDMGLFGQVDARSTTWATKHAAELVTQITDSTRDMLRQTIAQGLQETDILGVADRIAKDYAFSPERALLIADTETAFANGNGAQKGREIAKDLGIKIKKEWLDHEGACPICVENALAGPIEIEDTFPDGSMTTPSHPRCHCTTVSVIED